VLKRPGVALAAIAVLAGCSSSAHRVVASGPASTTSIATTTTSSSSTSTTVASTTTAPKHAAPSTTSVTKAPPPATSTTAAPPTYAYVLGPSSSGSDVTVEPGKLIEVELSGNGEEWSPPTTSDSAVLAYVSGSTDATTGAAQATFRAVESGSADIKSSRRCLQTAGQVCPQYIVLWTVGVTVQ